jgi:hypothetical protein
MEPAGRRAVAPLKSKAIGMPELDYRGYHLAPDAYGAGWRVRIYAPGDRAPMLEAPTTPEVDGQEQVLQEARLVVDRNIRANAELSRPARRTWWGWN